MTIHDITEFVQSGAKERLESSLLSLQRKYDFASQQADQKSFFIGVADYVKAVCDSKILSLLLRTSILEERNKLIEERNRLTKAVTDEVDQAFTKLRAIIQKEKIKLPAVDHELEDYAGYQTGRVKSSQPIGTSLFACVRDLIFALTQAGKTDLVSDFVIVKNEGRIEIIDEKISPTYGKYRSAERELEQQRKIGIWGAWEELWWAYASVYEQKNLWNDWHDKRDQLSILNGSLLFGGMNDILEDRKPKSSHFDVTTFKTHLSRFHNRFLDEGHEILAVTEIELTKDGRLLEKGESAGSERAEVGQQFVYSPRTGKGKNNAKSFRLTKGRPPFTVFAEVYAKKFLPRKRVLKLLGLDDRVGRSANTISINELVKQIRETTNLTPDELVNNGGEITLTIEI